MFTVSLRRAFTGGTLAGLSHEGAVTFATRIGAESYAAAMRGRTVSRPCGGGSPYRVTSADVSG